MGGEIRAVSPLSRKEGLLALRIPYDTNNATFVIDMKGASLGLPQSASILIQAPDGSMCDFDRPVLYSVDHEACFLSAGMVRGGSNLIFRWLAVPQDHKEKIMTVEPGNVFFSYSHEDTEWLEYFEVMLHPLIRSSELTVWSDRQISAGDRWKKEITNALSKAKVAVLLVTPHFLQSDFIHNNELPPLLKAAKKQDFA